MKIVGFNELLEEHGLKLTKTGKLTTEIDTRLGCFLDDLASQIESDNLRENKSEIVNRIIYDLDTYRIENTSIGQGSNHNNAIISALEFAYDCTMNHIK